LRVAQLSHGGPSHTASEILSRTIAEGEIVAGNINCPVTEVK